LCHCQIRPDAFTYAGYVCYTVEPRFKNLIRSWTPFVTRNVRKPKLLWPHGVLFNNILKKPQNTMKFKRRHGEFEQGCVLSESNRATDTVPLILPACRQPLLPACVFVSSSSSSRLAAAGGDPTISTQAILFGPIVRRGLWLPPIISRERPCCLSAGAPRQGAPTTSLIEYRCTSTGSARSYLTECRGTPTGGARNQLDRWSSLLAKEGICRA
jgi:hypothetical protein